MTKDPKSAYCVKCKKKNDVIAYMVENMGGASAEGKAQKDYFDQLEKHKS
jgi:hypothetical protein